MSSREPVSGAVRVELIVLTEQILAVIIPVRRAHDDVDVLAIRHIRMRGEVPQVDR